MSAKESQLAFTIVPVAVNRSSSVATVIGVTATVLMAAPSGHARSRYGGLEGATKTGPKDGSIMPNDRPSITSVRLWQN